MLSEYQRLNNAKHISLETYKKNNQPVRTPVWFVQNNGMIYVITRHKTGKVKRLKHNPCVKISLCTFNGKIIGKWTSGIAKFANESDTKMALDLRKKKYGFMDKIARFVSKTKGELVVFSISLDIS